MTFEAETTEIIVVGAGHAGIEAAMAAARLGHQTICFTTTLDFVGNMPCNPAIGGTGKGQIVREIDALGGVMGKIADKASIQYRILNKGKGPAVYSLRAQTDRNRYTTLMKELMENTVNLTVKQAEVIELLSENGKVTGVLTQGGGIYRAKAVILCCGTFLGGKTFVGDTIREGGPDGVFAANKLTQSLRNLGLPLRRFKTGTPSRIDGKTVDYSKCAVQHGDQDALPFSFDTTGELYNDAVCYLTYTNEKTHEIIRQSLSRSPLYSGEIEGVGPRYCPSIEDKVVRFPDKIRHQIFLEPCGLNTRELYVGGFSTSLPEDVQINMLRTIEGLEKAVIVRPGYAIEYDCLDPTCLYATMAVKDIEGLYAAGQLCSTSGYEEAAGQGLIAGINASRFIKGQEEFLLSRADGYIGTLIDDIVTKGTDEPYRMMTSRSEYRLWHRQDNADFRLMPKGFEAGLISEKRLKQMENEYEIIKKHIEFLEKHHISPEKANEMLDQKESNHVQSGTSLKDLLKRPELSYSDVSQFIDEPLCEKKLIEQVEISVKYEGYLKRQEKELAQRKKWENYPIPEDIDYNSIQLLRIESRQKLSKVRPKNLGQAGRISGVSPADISALILYVGKEQ